MKYTFDTYWHDIFKNCSVGKFPKGLRFDPYKNTIALTMIKKGAKNQDTLFTIPDNPIQIFTLMMKLFATVNLVSNQQIQVKILDMNQISKDKEYNSWEDIKLKHIKNYYIMNFISQTKDRYKLTDSETNQLFSVIQVGLQFKQLSNSCIIFKDGSISSISNLEFDDDTRIFSLNLPLKVNAIKKEKNITDKFITNVTKYIKIKCIKHDKTQEFIVDS